MRELQNFMNEEEILEQLELSAEGKAEMYLRENRM